MYVMFCELVCLWEGSILVHGVLGWMGGWMDMAFGNEYLGLCATDIGRIGFTGGIVACAVYHTSKRCFAIFYLVMVLGHVIRAVRLGSFGIHFPPHLVSLRPWFRGVIPISEILKQAS
ncbi:hypothetical protein F4778DRAFT_718701 [Xylariomycetidae sp. FL2044]|nr:hypothetical protein F4778DRAFT_718701 [Xylariomycetidae sp. FL2044]